MRNLRSILDLAWVPVQNGLTVSVLVLGAVFRDSWASPPARVAGLGLLGLGGWLGIAGVRALGRNRTSAPRPLADSTLVRHGVYTRVRHPLYGSVMLLGVGWALIWASGAALAAAAALNLWLQAKARAEEHWLRDRYPDYRDYELRVKRFVPGLW